MAEASVPGRVYVSDQVIEFPCSLCHEDGVEVEAIAYCTNCNDYLCRPCLKAHRRHTKGHELLEGKQIRDAEKYGSKTVHDLCDKHKYKTVDYFCLSHGQLICQECKDFHHRRCLDVKSIDDVSQGLHGSQQALRFLDDTKALIRDLKTLQQTRAGSLRQLEQQKTACLDDIKALRLEINSLLDRLEKEMQREISRVSEQESLSLNEQLSTLGTAVIEMEKKSGSLGDIYKSGDDRQVFIVMQNTSLEKMKEFYQDLKNTPTQGPMVFERDGKIENLLETLNSIGKLSVATVTVPQISPGTTTEGGVVASGRGTQDKLGEKVQLTPRRKAPSKPLPRAPTAKGNTATCHVIPGSQSGRKLARAGSHPVRDKGDSYNCWITGAKFLQDGRCILCDYNNRKLKLLDPGLRLQSSVEMSESPWDIALLSEDEAVVTLPEQNELQFVSVGRELKLGRTLTMEKDCYGIVVYNSHLFVTCQGNYEGSGEVVVLDLTGKCLRRFGVNQDGTCTYQFTNPNYIAVDGEGRLYVSDRGTDTVSCLSPAGKTLYCYRDRDLPWPQQLLVDSDRNVYVCSQASNTVQVISGEGRKLRTVLTASDGLSYPFTLAYRSSDQTLVVGMVDNDNILSFRFQ